MAIHPHLHSQTTPSTHQRTLTSQQASAISAWTEQAAARLLDLTLGESVPIQDKPTDPTSLTPRAGLRGTTVPLTIPLDDDETQLNETRLEPRFQFTKSINVSRKVSVSFRREPSHRDSLKRRETLLKGKDGSRRRQRWENDRLLHNPWAEQPAPGDWQIQPTYPRHDPMPYYLAPLWDVKYAHKDRASSKQTPKGTRVDRRHISKEVRMKLKHARAARGMLQDLEEDIRLFIQRWNEKQLMLQEEGLADAPSPISEDEDFEDEVVFVGRTGEMHDSPARKRRLKQMQLDAHKMVFESSVDDRAAGFGRWLVYSLASYYSLHTWSVTAGEPARRAAYVGIYPPTSTGNAGGVLLKPGDELPKPLWAQI